MWRPNGPTRPNWATDPGTQAAGQDMGARRAAALGRYWLGRRSGRRGPGGGVVMVANLPDTIKD